MSVYKIISEAGANWSHIEVGEQAELDLDEHTERAVVAAGWVEPVNTKAKGAN